MEDLHLKLIRVPRKTAYCEGILVKKTTTGDVHICDTLEDPIRDINGSGKFEGEEQKVYGDTAIPYGTYQLEVTWSPKFQMGMVQVKEVPHFTGIRMHWGRTKQQSYGCILVGKKDGAGTLANTGMTDYLVELVKAHGNKATLQII